MNKTNINYNYNLIDKNVVNLNNKKKNITKN